MTADGGRDFAGPLLVVQGAADLVVPAVVTYMQVNATCKLFPRKSLEYQSYQRATHISVMYAAQHNWLKWVADRFEGKPAAKGCKKESFESALPDEQYQGELNWFIQYALDTYETQ